MAGRQGRRRFKAIRRLPSGRYQVRYRTVDGRYVTAPTTFETKGDAGRYLSKVEADMLRVSGPTRAKLEADGVGQATRAKAYRMLARILGAAVEARYLAVNPCGTVGRPGSGPSRP